MGNQIDLSVGRIHVLTVNNCSYCEAPDGKHLTVDCPGDFPRRYRELADEIARLRQEIEALKEKYDQLKDTK